MRADVTAEHSPVGSRHRRDRHRRRWRSTSTRAACRKFASGPIRLRVRVAMSVGPWQGIAAWDVHRRTDRAVAHTGDHRPDPRRADRPGLRPRPSSPRRSDHPRTRYHQHPLAGLRRHRPTDRRGHDDELLRSARAKSHNNRGANFQTRQLTWPVMAQSRSEMGDRTLPALLEHIGNQPMSGGETWIRDATSFGDDRRLVGTLRHWRHSDIGPASQFRDGTGDEVSRWISKWRAQLGVELAPDDAV